MSQGPRFLRQVDIGSPINRSHRLNRGRASWIYGLPAFAAGCKAIDICRLETPISTISGTAGFDNSRSVDGVLLNGAKFVASGHPDLAILILDNASNNRVLFGTPGTGSSGNPNQQILGRAAFTFAVSGFVFNTQASSPNIRNLAGANDDTSPSYLLRLGDSGAPTFAQFVSTVNHKFSSSVAFPIRQWVRMVVTWDGLNYKMYQNSILVASGTDTTINVGGSFIPLVIGAGAQGTGDRFWNGLIKNVTMIGRAWSADEVREDFILEPLGYPGVLDTYQPGHLTFFGGAAPARSYATVVLVNQSAGYSQIGGARTESNSVDVDGSTSGDLVSVSQPDGGGGGGGGLTKTFRTVVNVVGAETIGQPLLRKYSTVVSAGASYKRGFTKTFANVVGAGQSAQLLIDGRLDLMNTIGYRR